MKVTIEKKKDGSIDFKKDKTTFRFKAKNFEKHLKKRPQIGEKRFQQEIADTLESHDCITQRPKVKGNKIFYKVMSYQDTPKARYVTFWKIPVFYKNKNFAEIATCILKHSPNYYAINPDEKIIWKKPNSQI